MTPRDDGDKSGCGLGPLKDVDPPELIFPDQVWSWGGECWRLRHHKIFRFYFSHSQWVHKTDLVTEEMIRTPGPCAKCHAQFFSFNFFDFYMIPEIGNDIPHPSGL